MCGKRLSLTGWEEVGPHPVNAADRPASDSRRVPRGADPIAASFAADEADTRVADERVERADRVRAAADAGDDGVGQPAGFCSHLLPGLDADHPLEVAHHHRAPM